MDDVLKTLATIQRHRDLVRAALTRVTAELEMRAIVHDASKLRTDEVEGFCRINKAARDHPYGSDEYNESMRREKPTIELHFSRNTHHPEYHDYDQAMGFLDIIEMVCDWHSASVTYGNNTLRESLDIHEKRFHFTKEQWWLIMQVVDFLEPD